MYSRPAIHVYLQCMSIHSPYQIKISKVIFLQSLIGPYCNPNSCTFLDKFVQYQMNQLTGLGVITFHFSPFFCAKPHQLLSEEVNVVPELVDDYRDGTAITLITLTHIQRRKGNSFILLLQQKLIQFLILSRPIVTPVRFTNKEGIYVHIQCTEHVG